jgi:membrane-associated phospholipid phosphatase
VGADLVRVQILNTIATHGTKALVDRRRPDGAQGSFPSGHASASFATAAVLQRHYGWRLGFQRTILPFTQVPRVLRRTVIISATFWSERR